MKRKSTAVDPSVYVSYGRGPIKQPESINKVMEGYEGPAPIPVPTERLLRENNDPELLQNCSDRVLEVGRVVASLIPPSDISEKLNTFFLGVVKGIDLRLSCVTLSQLTYSDESNSYRLSAVMWTEEILSLTSVSGKWCSDDKTMFIISETEKQRLSEMSVDMT